MRPLLLAFLLAGCTTASTPTPAPDAPPGAGTEDDQRHIVGTVTAVDFDPMAYDGDGIITVETDEGATVRVYIAARTNLCPADLTGYAEVQVGDAVEVLGRSEDADRVRPCESEAHYFRRR